MVCIATHKGASLTSTQQKVASQTTKSKHQQLKDSVDGVLRMIDERVAYLAAQHKQSPAYFLEQIHQGGCMRTVLCASPSLYAPPFFFTLICKPSKQ